MSNNAKVEVAVEKKQKQIVVRKNARELVIDQTESVYVEWWQLAKKEKKACFMLSFEHPDGRKMKVTDMVGQLALDSMFSHVKQPLKTSILFVSDKRLLTLQNHIHNKFPELKFVLVRLNRDGFPKLRYCNI